MSEKAGKESQYSFAPLHPPRWGKECDKRKVPDGMPDSFDPLPLEFFMNPKCPSGRAPTKATTTKAK